MGGTEDENVCVCAAFLTSGFQCESVLWWILRF